MWQVQRKIKIDRNKRVNNTTSQKLYRKIARVERTMLLLFLRKNNSKNKL